MAMVPLTYVFVIFALRVGGAATRQQAESCSGLDVECEGFELDQKEESESSIHLLQRTATLLKTISIEKKQSNEANSTKKEADAEASKSVTRVHMHEKNAILSDANVQQAQHQHIRQPHAGTNVPFTTLYATTGYTICQAVIIAFGALVLIAFLRAESVAKGADKIVEKPTLPAASSLTAAKFRGLRERVLQDFLPATDAPCFIAVDGRAPLTFKQLRNFVNSPEVDVSKFGITGNDRLAVILGDGPESAVAFWAFSAQCAYSPINIKATDSEIAFTLQDLPAKAIVLRPEDGGRIQKNVLPTIQCIPDLKIIQCIADLKITGLFKLQGPSPQPPPVQRAPVSRESVALVIQTSGTTKKPKQVPLTHENLILCCKQIAEMIDLKPEDRSLNFLPLFHIGGISNNVIAPVISQSSVVYAPHFTGDEVFQWILQYKPTWYYGSPTTHILIMRDHLPPERPILRLIRNATAALLKSTAEDMERFWHKTDILPGYGMSECTPIASHQCGKLRNLASVGPPAGPEVRIDDNNEICIRGPAVFSGYEVREHMDENPNIAAFEDDWFHTGDCGRIDEIGYLSITGRNKEIIIRGGENISPFDVEDAIVDDRVKGKIAFVVPHEELGEVVGLAVKTTVPDDEVGKLFVDLKRKSNLDPRKMPELIVKMDELPMGLAGKLKRIGLAKLLKLPKRSITRADTIAYTFSNDNLTELDFQDDVEVEVDSLGLAKGAGGMQIQPEIKQMVMCMYGMAAFMVVAFHNELFIEFPSNQSTLGRNILFSMSGNLCGGVRWSMQTFMGCASILNSKEPFQPLRVVILLLLYFGLQCPIAGIAVWLNQEISQEPVGSWFVLTQKRWFVGAMLFSYVTFAGARHLPFHGLQCTFWAITTFLLLAFPPNMYGIYNIFTNLGPNWYWVNFWFIDVGVCNWFVWSGCVMVYFTAGYYGHEFVDRVLAHPWMTRPNLQRRITTFAPIIFFAFLLLLFCGDGGVTIAKGIAWESSNKSYTWSISTTLLDQLQGLVMIFLLSQVARSAGPWVGWMLARAGASSLGIYVGCGLVFYGSPMGVPGWEMDTASNPSNSPLKPGSMAFFIDRIPIVPPLQNVLTSTAGFWPLQVFLFLVYIVLQIIVVGMPFHQLYLKVLNLLDAGSKKLGLVK